jgi:DUF1365 family protein
MNFRSQIYRGEVVHERLAPRRHTFRYPMTFFGFDLAELPQLHRQASVFGYNEARPLRINDSDYLHGRSKPILEQLDALLPPQRPGQHTRLISSPRYFGYAFNPVNFHLRMQGERLLGVVAEVNNTFGDRHVYPLTDLAEASARIWTAQCPKDFHVSPFNDMEGSYHFTFRIEPDGIFLGVDLHKEGECVMKTWVRGTGQPLSNESILRYALFHPFDTALNSMPRILWQAAVLHYKKRMEIHKRPVPESEHTLVDRDAREGRQPVV